MYVLFITNLASVGKSLRLLYDVIDDKVDDSKGQ